MTWLKFCQKELWIDRKDAVRLSKDEYFIADLIDMEVCDEEGVLIGILKDVNFHRRQRCVCGRDNGGQGSFIPRHQRVCP